MEEWKEYKLGEITNMKNGKKRPQNNGVFPVYGGNGIMGYSDSYNAENAIIVGRVGAYCGCVYKCESKCWVSDNAISIFAKDIADTQFLYYLMTTLDFHHHHIGGAQPLMTQDIIGNFTVSIPPLSIQHQIIQVLKSLDDKIEVNKRINDNLEQQAQALFNYYFIDTPALLGELSVGSLADAANYVNGLAMQKYRPINGKKGLPVLKIKELGQGRIDASSDFCSNEIDSYYKVYDGDVIFSWSGTLMVKIWCGGKCGLNQHLFKVSSKTTPKWFYYFWTKHHLDNFIRIAKDKAVTMGHIKRGELEKAEVLFPNNSVMKKLDTLMAPFLDQIIEKECEIRKLALLRDTLLPKLMSGELKINDINN